MWFLRSLAILFAFAAMPSFGQDWVSVGPEGGAVIEVRTALDDPDTSYAVTDSGGLFKTTDGGMHWRSIQDGIEPLLMTFLERDPESPNVLYTGTKVGSEQGGGLFRSTDRGETWLRLPFPGESHGAESLAIPAYAPDTLYLVPYGEPTFVGGYKSTDRGQTWSALLGELPFLDRAGLRIAADPIRQGEVYYSSGAPGLQLYKSVDHGASWTAITSLNMPALFMEFDTSSPGTIYFGWPQMFRTEDAGETWERVSQFGQTRDLWIDPRDSDRLVLSWGSGLSQSLDRGATWTSFPAFEDRRVYDLEARAMAPARMLAGTSTGVYSSEDDGATWSRRVEGLIATRIVDLAVDEVAGLLLAADLNAGLRRSEDRGLNWQSVQDSPIAPRFVELDRSGNGYSAGIQGVHRSEDAGLTWSLPDNDVRFSRIDDLVAPSAAPGRVYAVAGTRVFRSDDFARTFTETHRFPGLQRELAVPPDDPNRIYVAGTPNGLEVSVDGGESFEAMTGLPGTSFYRVRTDPTDGRVIYLFSNEQRLFKSGDRGVTWLEVGAGLPEGEFHDDLFVDALTRAVFIVSRTGLYRSTDLGSSFERVADGLPPAPITALVVDPAAPSRFYAATDGRGAFVKDRGASQPCVAGGRALCLNDGRFRVEALWRTPDGRSGLARAEPLTADTGYFWFFNAANIELIVKVLDACAFSDRFWAFAGGLTNIEVDLVVTDSESGEQRTYRNPQGVPMEPIQDTQAFATCP